MSKLLMLFMVLLVPPFVYGIGLLFPYKEENKYRFSLPILYGAMGFFACFELFAVLCTFLETSLSVLTCSFLIFSGACCVFSYVKNCHRALNSIKALWQKKTIKWIAFLPVLVLIMIQICIAVFYMHIDQDDAFFVATAVTSLETDTLFQYSPYTGATLTSLPARYVFSPFFLLYGVFGKIFQLPPAVVAHTVLPTLLIGLCYCVYWIWATGLFPKSRTNQAIFLFFVCLLNMWGYYSVYSSSTFLLIRIWQGKAILASTLLPFLFYLLFQLYKNNTEKHYWSILLSTIMGCCLVSSMGVALALIMTGIAWILYLIRYHKLKESLVMLYCCAPCILIGIAYLLLRSQEVGS